MAKSLVSCFFDSRCIFVLGFRVLMPRIMVLVKAALVLGFTNLHGLSCAVSSLVLGPVLVGHWNVQVLSCENGLTDL